MQKLPIGIQDFREIRNNGYLYIDKTLLIHQLISTGKYYFFSRPRRFGKSLLLSVMNEIFSGSKDLFKGLWIENNRDWQQVHPVINLRFASAGIKTLGLEGAFKHLLDENAKTLNIILTEKEPDLRFKELIIKAGKEKQVVILVDEYDKPIIDFLTEPQLADANKGLMKVFYSVLKDCDPYIKFLFITGVSRFSRVSIFSDLNNLRNITQSHVFEELAGITQAELEHYFEENIAALAAQTPGILQQIKDWYNGYSWTDGVNTLYNPFSLLCFFSEGRFQNFWFETGTPTFLVEQIRNHKEFDYSEREAGSGDLSNFDIENLPPVTLLFQTGYLTIKSYDPFLEIYKLGYPNKEVRSSLINVLLSGYRHMPNDSRPAVVQLYRALAANDMQTAVAVINSTFQSIPYDLWRGATELYYHALFHLTFSLLGAYIRSEVHTSGGRCDSLVETETHIFAFEFKLDVPAGTALEQILHHGYLNPWMADNRIKIAVGISFSTEERKIKDWVFREIF
jgi:hypothetical protein